MTQVKFTKFGANSAFGGFAPGDSLRCSAEMARHLVDEVKCAKYMTAPVEAVEVVEVAAPVEVFTKKRKAK